MKDRQIKSYDDENNLRQLLLKTGLNKREVEIFIALARLGKQPGSVIAKNLEMKRTTVYHCLQRLSDRGFVNCSRKNNTSFFVLNDLNEAIHKLEYERNDLEVRKKSLVEISHKIRPENFLFYDRELSLRDFQGRKSIKKLKMSSLENTKKLLIFASPSGDYLLNELKEKFWQKFLETAQKKKIELQVILPNCGQNREIINLLRKNNVALRLAPIKLFPLVEKYEISISDKRLILIGENYGAELNALKFAKLLKAMFELAWGTL